MDPLMVCVLDMDECIGKYRGSQFHVRPFTDTLIGFFRLLNIKLILWSLGGDDYVRRCVNGFLPAIKKHASFIFAKKECTIAYAKYGYYKASKHIRDMFDSEIYLLAIDDKVSTNMDKGYDLRVYICPYNAPNSKDKGILDVLTKIILAIEKYKEQKGLLPPPIFDSSKLTEEEDNVDYSCII